MCVESHRALKSDDGSKIVAPLPSVTRRTRCDFGERQAAIAYADRVTRPTRGALDALIRANGGITGQ